MSLQEDVKKKVRGYLFLSPLVLSPFLIGVTALILTWANDGPAWLGLSGFFGVISSVGIGLTRFLFKIDYLYQKAWEFLETEKNEKQKEMLVSLREDLKKEKDKRVTASLRELIAVFESFQEKVAKASYPVPAKSEITDKVKILFDACIEKLKEQHQIWKDARKVSDTETLNKKRESVIADIKTSIDSMRGSIDGCLEMADSQDLSSVRDDLETSMRIAKNTDRRMTEMGLREKVKE